MASTIRYLTLMLLVVVALAVTACSDREPLPTLVPLPTYTPMPTYTPVPKVIPIMGVPKKEVVVEKIVVQTVVVVVTATAVPTKSAPTARPAKVAVVVTVGREKVIKEVESVVATAVPAAAATAQPAPTAVPTPIWIPMTVDVEVLPDTVNDKYSHHVFVVITNPNDELLRAPVFKLIALDEEGLAEGEMPINWLGIGTTDLFVPEKSSIATYGVIKSGDEFPYSWELRYFEESQPVFDRGERSRVDPNNIEFFSLEGDYIINRTDEEQKIFCICQGYVPIDIVMAYSDIQDPLPAFERLHDFSHLLVAESDREYRLQPKSKQNRCEFPYHLGYVSLTLGTAYSYWYQLEEW